MIRPLCQQNAHNGARKLRENIAVRWDSHDENGTARFGLEPNWAADKYVQFFKDHLEVTSWLHDLGLLKGEWSASPIA